MFWFHPHPYQKKKVGTVPIDIYVIQNTRRVTVKMLVKYTASTCEIHVCKNMQMNPNLLQIIVYILFDII